MTVNTIFVDTTLQVDGIIKDHVPEKSDALRAMLASYDLRVGCTYSLVELKRVVLKNLSLCLSYLIEEDSYYRAMERISRLGARGTRKMSTLISIWSWCGLKLSESISVATDSDLDEHLKLQSISFIRINIFSLWIRFKKNVDGLLDATQCSRAKEAPRKDRNGNVILVVRQSLCRNGECSNASFFRSQLPMVNHICNELDRFEKGGIEISDELKNARAEMRHAMTDQVRLYDYNNCLTIGDIWIHLESLAGSIKDFGTSNYKESQHLCQIMGLNIKNPYASSPATE